MLLKTVQSNKIDPQLRGLALTHRAWAYENGGAPHNERREFLGDAVLGVVVTEHLYRTYPDEPEGWLAKMRAAVVNTYALADVAHLMALATRLTARLAEAGRTLMLVTHDPDEARALADGIVIVAGGEVTGPHPVAVLDNPPPALSEWLGR